jgi:sugar phosphate isomerase/epimerase
LTRVAQLRVYQSLWATEQRRAGVPEKPVAERFDAVKEAGYDGLAIDLGALELAAARRCVREYARTGLSGMLTAFPTSIEALRPALHLAKDIGAPFVIVVGQVMPLAVHAMIPVVQEWLRVAAEESMPIQFETHRNCITNELFATLQMLEAVPEMRLSADLSHYVVAREMMQPISAETQNHVLRVLQRSDSFQGRIATRNQIQVPIAFPQHRDWLETFMGWWREGFRLWRHRAPGEDLVFLCELGPPNYAMTDARGNELSDRWQEALELKRLARALWAQAATAGSGHI